MRQHQGGFTLIELVMVIVILGILAATALPKFVDLKSEANTAALNGVVGALNSANVINYGARSVTSSKGSAVANCSDGATLLEGGLPTGPNGYTITAAPIAAGVTATCTVTQTSTGNTGTFRLTGIS